VVDPRVLHDAQLDVFEIASIGEDELAQVDEQEPLVLEGFRLDDRAAQELIGVPLEVSGCVVENCDLSCFEFFGVRNSLFSGCKLRSTRFATVVRDVVFDCSQLTECRFRMATLERVVFERSQLLSCDFYGSELRIVSFPGSKVEGVGFDRCTLTDVDLTKAIDLQIGDPRTLMGASMCETQMPLIAARLAQLSGINVGEC
jgi:uncharacterized protein YjbI with pentapeptide repeats